MKQLCITSGKGIFGTVTAVATNAVDKLQNLEPALQVIAVIFGALITVATFFSIVLDIRRKVHQWRNEKHNERTK